MPSYNFLVEMNSIGKGYIKADSLEQAKERITNGEICEYGDIYDEVESEVGEIIEIEEVK